MDAVIRGFAIFLEWLVLSAILYAILKGVRLMLPDFGIGAKYTRGINIALVAAGSLGIVFFLSHLAVFYPDK